ncbi:MAG: cupin domain-containing protein [Candidatus Mcinerneyibacterium aminivorans]|uniref:Cupin domain-containing protein n=1 Tax=Candidatus Mcinerneyibacterium aminivorans TaxID=2703815 RepID=A0A5D0MB09_9BACT|nr:MAG: cupin domain-containing protein [Candidatus Mcinerneyibacterium aminivorans]
MEIKIMNKSKSELENLNVYSWPIWEKEKSKFSWEYTEKEQCYILKGRAIIKPKNKDKKVTIKKGDFVEFPEGMKCTWEILEDVKKHYTLG